MNLQSLFQHWSIAENPFRAEEARHDPVFARLGVGPTMHPDFDKILGDLSSPSSAIVFGEKGSGKTAIRLQIAERVAAHNLRSPDARVMLVPYDELNPVLDAFCVAEGVDASSKPKAVTDRLARFALTDHLDAVLSFAVTRFVDRLLDRGDPGDSADLPGEVGDDAARSLRRSAGAGLKRALLCAQSVYDRHADAPARTASLRRAIGAPRPWDLIAWRLLAAVGWVVPVGAVVAALLLDAGEHVQTAMQIAFAATAGLWAFVLVAVFLVSPWLTRRTSRRIVRHTPAVGRGAGSVAASLAQLGSADRRSGRLPADGSDEARYATLAALLDALRRVSCRGMVVVLDRVDEPTLINGDVDRMRSVVWPMLNAKLLQHDGLGVKMLLPIELRHELFRESTQFFQEARLDKQNMVERLTWTGAMLYDLCAARLNACLTPDADPVNLSDLFEADVSRQDVIDALDQMHQPRDAFKLLYQCMQEHCSNVSEEQAQWKIPRLVLETVRKQQAERVQMLYRGVRPA